MKSKILLFALIIVASICVGFTINKTYEKDVIEIDIGYQSVTSQTWGALIMKNKKIFENKLKGQYPNHKIIVTWHDEISGAVINTGMISGKIQFGFMGDMPLVLNMYKASTMKKYDSMLIAFDGIGIGGKNQSILVSKNSNIKDVNDLVGKTISTPIGSSAHYMLMKVLEKHGLLNKVNVAHQDVAMASQLLSNNKTDALSVWAPYPNLLLSEGSSRVLVDGEETNIDYLAGVIVNNNWAKQNKKIVEIFIESLDEAHDFINKEPLKAAEIFSEESNFDINITKKEVTNIVWNSKIEDSYIDTLNDKKNFLVTLGQVSEFDLRKYIYSKEV